MFTGTKIIANGEVWTLTRQGHPEHDHGVYVLVWQTPESRIVIETDDRRRAKRNAHRARRAEAKFLAA